MPVTPGLKLLDLGPSQTTFLDDVLAGLDADQKSLPCKYFYDARGSQLFDQICELDEYYLTRAELQIMQQHAPDMGAMIGPGAAVVEYGSGSSIKTRLLLDALPHPSVYAPMDISREHLERTAAQLNHAYPPLKVSPICADFTEPFDLPQPVVHATPRVVYFPGSTIGNFEPPTATKLIQGIANVCDDQGGLLIGIDLKKDRQTLEAAYNDRRGITAEFNLNLLHRINNELDANFDMRQFQHQANYDEHHGRMDISLISLKHQTVQIGDKTFEFQKGESIHTEYSHKYNIPEFAEMAKQAAGFQKTKYWQDEKEQFAVLYLQK